MADSRSPGGITGALAEDMRQTVRTRRGIMVFCPHRMVASVAAISAVGLVEQGIRGVILDMDNTLVRWQQEELPPEIEAWLEELKSAGLARAIVSNSVFGRRVERIAQRLDAPYVRLARKPAVQGFRKAMDQMGVAPEATVVIGDQMFTDIWGGNRVGAYTVLVQPIHAREFAYTRFVSRPPERLLLRWFMKKGLV